MAAVKFLWYPFWENTVVADTHITLLWCCQCDEFSCYKWRSSASFILSSSGMPLLNICTPLCLIASRNYTKKIFRIRSCLKVQRYLSCIATGDHTLIQVNPIPKVPWVTVAQPTPEHPSTLEMLGLAAQCRHSNGICSCPSSAMVPRNNPNEKRQWITWIEMEPLLQADSCVDVKKKKSLLVAV